MPSVAALQKETEDALIENGAPWWKRARLQFERGLWRMDTASSAVRIALSVVVLLVGLVLLMSVVWPPAVVPSHEPRPDLSGNLGTIAQVAGGVFAAALAVFTFGIQSLASRTDEAAILVSYTPRRLFVMPVTAWVTGATVSSCVLEYLLALSPDLRLNGDAVVFAGLLGLCISLALTIWVFYEVVLVVTAPTARDVEPVVLWDMAEVVVAERRLDLVAAQMPDALKGLVVDADRIRWHMSDQNREVITEAVLPAGRQIVDVDVGAVRQLDKRLRQLDPELRATLMLGVGMTTTRDPAVRVWRSASPSQTTEETADEYPIGAVVPSTPPSASADKKIPIPESRVFEIRVLASKVFELGRLKPTRTKELNQVIRRLQGLMKESARLGNIERLESVCVLMRSLLQAWLKIPRAESVGSWRASWFRVTDGFVGPFNRELYDVLRAGAASRDLGVVEVLTDFLSELYYDSFEISAAINQEVTEMLAFVYWRCCREGIDAERVRDVFERRIHLVLAKPNMLTWKQGDETKLPDDHRAGWERALAFALQMIKTAIEEDKPEDAQRFIGHLAGNNENLQSRFAPNTPLDPSSAAGLREVALMYVAGWACLLHKRGGRGAATARRVIKESLPRRNVNLVDVIWLWEQLGHWAIPGVADRGMMGAERWSIESEHRYGAAYIDETPWQWPVMGFAVRALTAIPPAANWVIDDCLSQPPDRNVWNPEQLKANLESAAGVLDLGEGATERVGRVQALIERRAMDALRPEVLAWLRFTLPQTKGTLPIPVGETPRVDAIRSLGAGRQAALVENVRVAVGLRMPRSNLKDEAERYPPSSDYLTSQFHKQDELVSIAQAEGAIAAATSVVPLHAVTSAIEEASAALRQRGFNPALVLIPSRNSVLLAVLGVDGFGQHRRTLRSGRGFVGVGEQTIMAWPHTNAESIVVADPAALFGIAAAGQDADWHIEDTPPEELTAAETKAKAATKPSELPSVNDVRATVRVARAPSLGLLDTGAAVRVRFTNQRGKFTVLVFANVIHHSGCAHVAHDDDHGDYLYLPEIPVNGPLAGLKRCPRCFNAGGQKPGHDAAPGVGGEKTT